MYFSIKAFWPEGQSVDGIYQEYKPKGLSRTGLTQAKNGNLQRVSADGLSSLLRVAAGLKGAPVDIQELLVQ